MAAEQEKTVVTIPRLDGGLYTRLPAHMIEDNQSPDCQNTDPSFEGGSRKRLGYIKFTSAAKSSPTGTFVSGLFAGAQSRSAADQVWQVTAVGPSYVDITTDFNDDGAGDCLPFPAVEAVGDYMAVGSTGTFSGLEFTVSTLGVAGTVAWEYWNGSSWSSLTAGDGTVGFTTSASGIVSWAIPGNWAAVVINGSASLYYVRARLTQVYSTNPVLTQGWTTPGKVMVLAAEGTTVQAITAGTWPTAITGATITVDTPVRMFMFNDKTLILNRGGGPYYTTNGTSASSLAGSPPGNSQFGMIHRSRIWLATGVGSSAAFSALNSEEDYTSADNAGSITINRGDGMVLNGMLSCGDFAIFSKVSPSSGGKEGKIYILYGSSPFDFAIKKIADFGALSHDAMIAFDNFAVIATHRGIYGIQGKYPFKMSDPIQPTWDAIANKGTVALGRYGTTVRIAYPATGTTNNRELVLDVERQVWGLNAGKSIRIYTSHPDGRLLFGTSSTSILVWEDNSGTSDDGSAIAWYVDTKDLAFNDNFSPSRLSTVIIHAATSPTATITVTQYGNGTVTAYSDTLVTNTEGPIKKMKQFIENRCTFHRIRLTDSSTSGQTIVYSMMVMAVPFKPGTQRSA